MPLPEWITTTFPEDLRKDPEYAPLFNPDDKGNPADMEKYATPLDLVKTYKNQLKVIGSKGVIVPDEKAAPEDWDKFYQGIGRPAKPEEYKFSEMKDLHPSLKVDPNQEKGFREFLFKSGVPAKQADAFNQYATRYLSDMIKSGEEAMNKQREAAIGELKKEWGDKYPEHIAAATKLVTAVLGDKAGDLGPLENSPAGLRFLSKIGSLISEDSLSKITSGGGGQTPDQAAAQEEINQIMADAARDKKHPLNDENNPDHGKWKGENGMWVQLQKRAFAPQK